MIIIRIDRKTLLAILISIIFLGIIILFCIHKFGNETELVEPVKVIEKYFKFYNDRDKEGVLSNVTPKLSNLYLGFENLVYIKFIDAQEDKEHQKRFKKDKNMKTYIVTYESKYIRDDIGLEKSGIHKRWYFLVRKDKKSKWLIDGNSYDLMR